MSCPDDNVLVAFATARLSASARAEVEHHLDRCSLCSMLVAEAARAPDGETTPVSGAPALDAPGASYHLPAGTVVGRYLVLEPLGSGGLGDVFAAYDPELDRRVAIKLLRTAEPTLGPAQLRLKREAQALARLAHPNVVAVHDVGEHQGRVFVAMELVEGQTLRAWVEAQPRGWKEIRDVMVEAGRGLAAAHAAGMVHRDFKPGNMMVGADGRVRVLDFGLARAISAEPSSGEPARPMVEFRIDGVVTRTGVVMGTPAYMAPEQHDGVTVDARADQFGFCCTLYEALLRERPFGGASFEELRAAIDAGPTLPMDRRGVPPWVLRAIERGLAPDPARRFVSMSALLHALRRDLRSRRFRVAALAGIVLAGSIGVIVGQRLAPPSAEQRDAIERAVERVRIAASHGHFVYPPVEAPDEATALIALEQLEALGSPAARSRAVTLRDELAGTLVELGDRYWDRDGGRPFAVEYYAQALVFDPESSRAAERAVVTLAGLDSLRTRAQRGEFSASELTAAAPLAALAQVEPDERRRRLYAAVSRGTLPAVTVAQIDRLEPGSLSESTHTDPSPQSAEPSEPVAALPSEPPGEPEAEPARATAAESPTAAPEAESASASSPKRDPKVAAAAARTGRAALEQGGPGGLARAEQAFHRALEADPRHVPALVGLAEVAFERGHFTRAERFARRAVKAEPRRGSHRILLGDALRRQSRYADARAQYEAAQAQGHAGASRRLASLAKLTGDAP